MDRRQLLTAGGALATTAAIAKAVPTARAIGLPAHDERALTSLARAERLVGAAVAVVRDGRLVGSWRFGDASLQFGVPVANDTLFAVASVAKHVTAMGILKLIGEGRIGLGQSIRECLPIVPEAWADRTIRSLLTHTSGLPDFTLAPKSPSSDDDPTREQLIERMRFREPLFAPGAGWSYSNSNHLLLGWLIEDRIGKPFAEALPAWVLRPAGLPFARADGPGVVTPKLAEPYVFDQKYWRVPFRQTGVAEGAGSLQWSIDDIAPWDEAMSSNRLANPMLRQSAVEWHRLPSGNEIPYGFGFFLDRVAGRAVHWHNGGSLGTVGMFLQLPNERLTVAVMSNTDTPGRVMRQMGWMAAHAFAPAATYLDRPALPGDMLDRRLAALCATPGPLKPDPAVIAPEFLRILNDPVEQRRFNPGFQTTTRLERIEEYRVGRGLMRRYRMIDRDHVDYKLAGFDENGKLFWLWGC